MQHSQFTQPDLFVFSHLRWDFVFQRPQHLLSRFAQKRRVFFIEEPIFDHVESSQMRFHIRENGVKIAVPHLPHHLQHGLNQEQIINEQRKLINQLVEMEGAETYHCWYYTPMALPFTDELNPQVTVYDCMDELSAFDGAHSEMKTLEDRLFRKADVVFTGGQSLYEAKKTRHKNVHCFPSSIDTKHFGKARSHIQAPADQAKIIGVKVGFFGVVDERFDIALIAESAALRPEWQFIIIGPVVKINPETLPKNKNIHYLGMKNYLELPEYIAGWDLAILPFARNASTRFISPTKTPEYLAAGKPVVSTSIRDVISPYADQNMVHIADTAEEFVVAAENAMQEAKHDHEWRARVDQYLSQFSWDKTCEKMSKLLSTAHAHNEATFEKEVRVPHYLLAMKSANHTSHVKA